MSILAITLKYIVAIPLWCIIYPLLTIGGAIVHVPVIAWGTAKGILGIK